MDIHMAHIGASLLAQMVKRLSAVQDTWVWSLGWEDPLEKEMATHSSILAWKMPWMEEPGRLQSMGLQRVWHDWGTSLSPDSSVSKESACGAADRGDTGLIPRSGRSPGEGNGNPLQYTCLENPMDRGAWLATVHGVAESRTQLSDFTFPKQFLLAVLWGLRWVV